MTVRDLLIRRNTVSDLLLGLSMLLFFVSLAVPAYVTTEGRNSQDHYGLEALLLGPIGFFAGHFAWVANLFLWASCSKRAQPGISPAYLLALLALPVASLFLLSEKITVGSAGTYEYYTSIGYYLWLASMAVAAGAALMYRQPSTKSADVS